MEITLFDTEGKSANFLYSLDSKGQLKSKTIWKDRSFGQSHTDHAEINGIDISGDNWRFFEGGLGLEVVYNVLKDEVINGPSFLEEFSLAFRNTGDDEEALLLWDLSYQKARSEALSSTFSVSRPNGVR